MVYFKGSYNFPRFQRGSNNFQGKEGLTFFPGGGGGGGGVQMLIPIETHRACDFPEGSGPLSPSGSAHGISFKINQQTIKGRF